MQQPLQDVGVIVGRFQVHELHDGHRALIDHVVERHEKVIIVLGLSPLPVSFNNPLDFESRKQMLLTAYPDVIVLYAKDAVSDDVWSRKLDEMISDVVTPQQTVVLYGSRDSFISHYTTKRFPTEELLQETYYSGSATRRAIARSRARTSPEFRAGVIWASQSRFPTVYTTVDIAVLNDNGQKVLLGRKPNEKLFRFPGGFAEPSSPTFEADARREVQEECGVEITDPVYIGSARVPDWRYRNEPDSIKTLLFKAKYLSGRPTPGDDIEEVRWYDLHSLTTDDVVPAHRALLDMFVGHFDK